MKKIIAVSCFIALSVIAVFAQETNNSYIGNYSQPSPNTASLGKYIDYPVSYFTGVPDISVPLYDLTDGAVHVPISLSYHGSGVRVEEIASWVGLGWNLNAGGMITRTVRGIPDEGQANANIIPRGYYIDSGLLKLPLLPHPVGGTIVSNDAQNQMNQSTLPALSAGRGDSEPDLFFFNFNGYSGRFVFDEHRTPVLLNADNLKISVVYDSVLSNFTSWVITAPDGARYYFGENNTYETTNSTSSQSGGYVGVQKPTGWYLTTVIYPNTKDTVKFNYLGEYDDYFDLGPESKLYNFDGAATLPNLYNICNDNSNQQQNLLETTAAGFRLSSIVSKNYTVSFISDTVRSDIGSHPGRLDSVKIYVNNGQRIKQWALSYGYFISSSANQIVNLPWLRSDYSDTLRLKLVSVKECSGDGTLVKPSYKFTYQETYKLPRRLSWDQDDWGYSNTATGHANNSFFMPGINYGSYCSNGGSNANRSTSWPQMSAFSLVSVQDPLGVVTKFDFEENNVSDYPYTNVGGQRILRITTTDSVTSKATVRKFTYGYGMLFHHPTYLINLQNEYYIVPNGNFYGYQNYPPNPAVIGMLKQSQSIVPMQDANGVNVGYPDVTEYFGENGEGGYKNYFFDMNSDDQSVHSRLDIANYASTQTITSQWGGSASVFMGNGNFNNILPQNLSYYTGYFGNNDYPYAPDQYEFRRGKLLIENTYDSSGNLIQGIQNNYIDSFQENYWMRGLKVYQTYNYHIPTGQYDFYTSYNYALTFYKLHTGIAHLGSTIVTVYKDGKSMVSVTKYGYESAYHTLRTSDTTETSQGDTLIRKTYYSFDYANSATSDGVFTKLKARNMLVPVATRLWKNNQLIDGTVTQYKDFASSGSDTLISPLKMYSLELSNPLTTTQAGENIRLTGLLPTLIPNTSFIEKADFNYNGSTGKIAEQNLLNDKNQSVIWDNQYNLPLAVVENAAPADVAFCSFETAEAGNWTITPASVVTDATAPTGTHAYTLTGTAVTKTVTSGKAYTVSYWLKSSSSITISGGAQTNSLTGSTINGWTYYQITLTTTGTTVSITGSGSVDELRLYPSTAQMVTYSYDSLLRLTDQCSVNNTISQYDYDAFSRLLDIKDQYGNIIKALQYNYGGLSR